MPLPAPPTSVPARLAAARSFAYVAVGAWALFAVVSLLVAVDATTSFDDGIQRAVAAAGHAVLTRASWLGAASLEVARLGSIPVAVGVIAAVSVLFAVWRRTLMPAVLLGTSFFFTAATVGGLKDLYHRAEPYDRLGDLGFSFPSGHTAVATVAWGGAALVTVLFVGRGLNRGEAILAVVGLGVALAVPAVMIARSAHWMSDVVGGAALGTAWLTTVAAVLLASVWRPARWRSGQERREGHGIGIDRRAGAPTG